MLAAVARQLVHDARALLPACVLQLLLHRPSKKSFTTCEQKPKEACKEALAKPLQPARTEPRASERRGWKRQRRGRERQARRAKGHQVNALQVNTQSPHFETLLEVQQYARHLIAISSSPAGGPVPQVPNSHARVQNNPQLQMSGCKGFEPNVKI